MYVDAELGDFVCVDNHSTVAHHVILSDGKIFPQASERWVALNGETAFIGAERSLSLG